MKILTRILVIFLSLLLTVLLTVTTLSASLISCVRAQFTPEYIYNVMNQLDYAALRLPDEDENIAPLCDIINDHTREFGIYFTEQDLNDLIRALSIDAVLTSYMQDIRSWALDDGPVPALNADEIAQTVLSGLDPSLYRVLSLFGEPEKALSDALNGMVSAADFSHIFEKAELIQTFLAADFMIFIISLSAGLFLVILIVNRLKLVPAAVYTGVACIFSGAVMIFLAEYLDLILQLYAGVEFIANELLYNTYYVLMDTVRRTGLVIAVGGLAAIVAFAVIGIFASMIAREKAAAREFSAAGHAYPAGFDYMQASYRENIAPPSDTSEDAAPAQSDENHNDTEY